MCFAHLKAHHRFERAHLKGVLGEIQAEASPFAPYLDGHGQLIAVL